MSFEALLYGILHQKRKSSIDDDALVGWSVRKLRNDYLGYCMEVRRSSDDATMNIGFRDGLLDTITLLEFCGNGDGFVRTWYDQSYNANDAVQNTNANQPQIVKSGVLETQNSKPAIYFYNTWMELTTSIEGETDFSTFNVISRKSGAVNAFGIATSVVGANGPYSIHLYNDMIYCCNTQMSSYIVDAVYEQVLCVNYAINHHNHLYKNGVYKILLNPGGSFPYDFDYMGRRGNDYMNGWIQEILWWTSDKMSVRETIESNILNYYNISSNIGNEVNDFIDITSITDQTIIDAIQNLHDDLINYRIWHKFRAIYPFVGGTEDTHKFNLKDPRDADDAFRLTFSGGLTHSASGVLGNGTSGYANTHVNPYSVLPASSQHVSYYSRTNNNSSSKEEMGVYYSGFQTSLAIKYSGTLYAPIGSASPSVSNSDSSGFFIASKYQSGKVSAYRNSSKVINDATSNDGNSNKEIYLFAWNNGGTAQRFTDRQCAFASIGEGLTPTEAGNFNTAVQAFQTALGRNV